VKIPKDLYISIYININMKYIGFNLDKEKLEKLNTISFILKKKNRSELIRDGIDYIINKYDEKLKQMDKYLESEK